ncbi:MAG: triose-phosphate isomerase [Patescibacteria group bacterium]|nr:triose-phosphate isomerase [Patescibacteria group bacterium]
MKKLFIIANWKSNKTEHESIKWIQEFPISSRSAGQFPNNKEIIICPSFVYLPLLKSYILDHNLPIKLGTQNISKFDEGAYTGEINGKQIKDFADYVIIGHSERRQNFSESEETINKKIEQAKKYRLTPILCVQNPDFRISQKIEIIAYEPVFAIGTNYPDTPENASLVSAEIKKNSLSNHVVYGGSVTSKNVKEFTQKSNIDGVLVGNASLDPLEFFEIIKNA